MLRGTTFEQPMAVQVVSTEVIEIYLNKAI